MIRCLSNSKTLTIIKPNDVEWSGGKREEGSIAFEREGSFEFWLAFEMTVR